MPGSYRYKFSLLTPSRTFRAELPLAVPVVAAVARRQCTGPHPKPRRDAHAEGPGLPSPEGTGAQGPEGIQVRNSASKLSIAFFGVCLFVCLSHIDLNRIFAR